jgi:hypothetical protein
LLFSCQYSSPMMRSTLRLYYCFSECLLTRLAARQVSIALVFAHGRLPSDSYPLATSWCGFAGTWRITTGSDNEYDRRAREVFQLSSTGITKLSFGSCDNYASMDRNR